MSHWFRSKLWRSQRTRVTTDFKLLSCDSSKASTGESKNQSNQRWLDFLWTILLIRHACEREAVHTVLSGPKPRRAKARVAELLGELSCFFWLVFVSCRVSHWLKDGVKTNTLTLRCFRLSNTKQSTFVSSESKSQTLNLTSRVLNQKAIWSSRLKREESWK